MHRNNLLEKLVEYKNNLNKDHVLDFKHEISLVNRVVDFVNKYPNCFDRGLSHGHITGSAWLLNYARDKALLMLHKKLNMWLQLGGHADGESDILKVALKEAREESGIADIEFIDTKIFDVDIHLVDHNCPHGQHYHYDIRFLLKTKDTDDFVINHESLELKWYSKEKILRGSFDGSVKRLAEKWIKYIKDRK